MSTPSNPPKLLKMRQVADLLGVTPNTVYVWVREGKFPSGYGAAKTKRWLEDEVIAWQICYFGLPDSPPETVSLERQKALEMLVAKAQTRQNKAKKRVQHA